MNKKSLIRWLIVLTATWVILSGKLSWPVIIGGFFCSIVVLKYTDRFLLGSPYHETHKFRFTNMFKYLFFMIKAIYTSGFQMIGMIITHKINPAIVEIETDLEDDFKRTILANSITLTPGTITVDLTGNKLKVLWINKTTDDPEEIRQSISYDIEERLRKL